MNRVFLFIVIMLVFFYAFLVLQGLVAMRSANFLNGKEGLGKARNFMITSYVLTWIAVGFSVLIIIHL